MLVSKKKEGKRMKSGSLKYGKRLEFTFVSFNHKELLDEVDLLYQKTKVVVIL